MGCRGFEVVILGDKTIAAGAAGREKRSLARYLVLTVTVLAVLSQFGIQTTSLIAVLGAAGLAIGLALQGTLSNLAAGVMLLIVRPFRIGHKVQIGGNIGTVTALSLFWTDLIRAAGFRLSDIETHYRDPLYGWTEANDLHVLPSVPTRSRA